MLLFVHCAVTMAWRLLNTLRLIAFPLQAPEKRVSVLCCVWPSQESEAVRVFAISRTTREKSGNPAAAKYVFRKTSALFAVHPLSGVTFSKGPSFHKWVACMYTLHLRMLKMILKTDFVLCYFPLSKQCLSPSSSSKIILEARLIVVAFPLNCISCSCLWDGYKFQHLCTLSFQVSLTFIEKDNIKLPSLSRSPPLLPSGKRLPCISALHAGGEACTDLWWIHSRSSEVTFSSMISSIYQHVGPSFTSTLLSLS